MSKKSIALVVLIAFLTIALYKIYTTVSNKNKIENNISALPNFTFYNFQQKIFTKDSLSRNKPILFIYFNTDCEHCQYEASEIVKNINAFTNTNVLFISNQSFSEINSFDSIYHLSQYRFIKLLKDSTNGFYKTFGTSVVPSVLLYNNKGELLNSYKGEVSIAKVIDQLK